MISANPKIDFAMPMPSSEFMLLKRALHKDIYIHIYVCEKLFSKTQSIIWAWHWKPISFGWRLSRFRKELFMHILCNSLCEYEWQWSLFFILLSYFLFHHYHGLEFGEIQRAVENCESVWRGLVAKSSVAVAKLPSCCYWWAILLALPATLSTHHQPILAQRISTLLEWRVCRFVVVVVLRPSNI